MTARMRIWQSQLAWRFLKGSDVSKESTEDDALRIAAIRKAASEMRVIPTGLVDFVVVQEKSIDDVKAIFETYQKTGSYSENGCSWGEQIQKPKAKE